MRRQKKNKFDLLPGEYKDAVSSMNPEEIRQRIAKITLDQLELAEAEKNDDDLLEKKEALRYALNVYHEEAKLNRLKLEFAKLMLER